MLQERGGIHPKPVTTKDYRTPLPPASTYRHERVVIVLAKRASVDSPLKEFSVILSRTIETKKDNGRAHYLDFCDRPITTKRVSYL